MIFTLPLMFLWIPFSGMDTVDVFLFKEHLEKPKWIAHDSQLYLINILLTYCIYQLIKMLVNHGLVLKKYLHVTKLFLFFAIFRLVEYFTFRGDLPMLPIVGGLIIYSLGTLFYNGNKAHNNR